MILGVTIAALAACLAFAISGARRWSYAAFYAAFLPFLTLDPSQGGLVTVDGLGGANVTWKLGMRALATAFVFALAWKHRVRVAHAVARPASWPVLVLLAWALVGLPRAHDPWVALFRLGELGVFFLTGVVLWADTSRDATPEHVARWHALALVPILIVAVALSSLAPDIAFHESSSGVRRMGHKLMNANVLGFAAVVPLIWATHALRRRYVLGIREPGERRHEIAALCVLVLSAYVLYHARSRSAALAFAVGQAILWFPWPDTARGERVLRRERAASVLAAVLLAGVVVSTLPSIEAWFLRGASSADVVTGTGRTGLWSELIVRQIPEAPLLGAGYLNLSEHGGFEHAGHHWNNAHSTYLFALVATGVPGLLAVLAIVLWPALVTLRGTFAAPPDERDGWRVLFAGQAIVAVTGITGFGVAGFPNVAMLFHYGLFAYATSGRADVACPRTFTAPQRPHRLSLAP